MVATPTVWDVALTGRTRHRTSLFRKQVLQVEEIHQSVRLLGPGHSSRGGFFKRWRDAKFDDLQVLQDLQHVGAPNAPPRAP